MCIRDRLTDTLNHNICSVREENFKLHVEKVVVTVTTTFTSGGDCHHHFFQKLPTTPALIALAFRHGMGYRYLNVRINSVNDAFISCKNFVNFGPVTLEKTGLICEFLYDMEKNWRI